MKMRKLRTQVEKKSTGPIDSRTANPVNSALPSIVDENSPTRGKDNSATRYANSLHLTNNKSAVDYNDMTVYFNKVEKPRGTHSTLKLGRDFSREHIRLRRNLD